MLKRILALPPVSFGLELAAAYGRVGISRSAAALAYFLILTLFPLLMCVNWFIGRFHLSLEKLLAGLEQVLPSDVLALLGDYLGYVSLSQSPALLAASLFTLVVSASAGLRALLLTMDQLYQVAHPHPVARFLLSILLSVLLLLTIYLSAAVLFTGDWFFQLLEERLPAAFLLHISLGALAQLWRRLRYLLLFSIFLLLVLLIYRFSIPRSLIGGRVMVVFALLAALAMAVCSAVFSVFLSLSSRYALVYGSLASLIILLVWLYLCGIILLLGAAAARVWTGRRR